MVVLPVDFSPVLNILVFFTLSSPIVGLISRLSSALRKLVDGYAIAGLLLAFYVATQQHGSVSARPLTYQFSTHFFSSSFLYVDLLSLFFSAIFIFVGIVSSLFATKYISERREQFFPLFLAQVTGMVGVVYSGDLFTFFVFWEMLSIASYVLVAFQYREWEATEASLKYLIMSAAGTATILFAISMLYGMTGTLNIGELARIFVGPGARAEIWSYIAIALLIGGFGVNAAVVPFHSWLPDAHPAAPSPISAMLSGVVIKTGVYALIRILGMVFPSSLYGWQLGLAAFAALTMILGNLMALLQEDIKRLLAFSSIANIGYILFGIAIATSDGVGGGLLHVLNHALMKALLFLAAGAFIHVVGTRKLDDLAGIGRKMPISALAYSIGAFSLAGMPGLNSFWSEYTIIYAGIRSGWLIISIIMLVGILLSVGYHLRVIQTIFLKPVTSTSEKGHEVPLTMLIPLIILATLAVLIGIYPSPLLELTLSIARSVTV